MELTLDAILPALLSLLGGGSIGIVLTWRWQKVKAQADAQKAQAEAKQQEAEAKAAEVEIAQKVQETYERIIQSKQEEVEDKMRLARYFAAQQFAQYGMSNLPDDVIDNYAHKLLEDARSSNDIEERAFDDKFFAAIKQAVTLEEKAVTVDEFNQLFAEQ